MNQSSPGTTAVPDGVTHMRRPEYLTAWLFDGVATVPLWLIEKYHSQPLPEHRKGMYATAIDGDFWRWFDAPKFEELFMAVRGVAQTGQRPIGFLDAMNIVERGFDTWKDKPHNAKWYSRIDGTPIPNDLKVNIAEAICHSSVSSTDQREDACSCGGGDISGHDNLCPYAVTSRDICCPGGCMFTPCKVPSTDKASLDLCAGGVDPGWDACPKCGTTMDDECAMSLHQQAPK